MNSKLNSLYKYGNRQAHDAKVYVLPEVQPWGGCLDGQAGGGTAGERKRRAGYARACERALGLQHRRSNL